MQSLGIGLSGLRSNMAAIETVGHNIANANTEGYSRQRVELSPRKANDTGGYLIGSGVQVNTIARITDEFLEDRVRREISLLSNLSQSALAMEDVEFVINELSESALSNKMNEFFSALQDFSNNVDDNSTRVALMEQAETLSQEFHRLDSSLKDVQKSLDANLGLDVGKVNLLISEIASINGSIVSIESGGLSSSAANDLRDKRDVALRNLSEIMNIDVKAEANGAVFVTSAGQVLVSQVQSFSLEAVPYERDGEVKNRVQYSNGTAFDVQGGRLEAHIVARDVKIAGIRDSFNEMAGRFIFELNKIQATGHGINGPSVVTSEHHVFDPDISLDAVRYSFTNNTDIFKVKNGSFDIVLENVSDGSSRTYTVNVDLNGVGHETTLTDIINELNAVPNINAVINSQKKIEISSTNSNVRFTFANDSSDFLATMGINNFFTGTGSSNIAVNAEIRKNAGLISGGLTTQDGDNQNAIRMVELRNKGIFNENRLSVDEFYQTIVGNIAVESRRAKDSVVTHELIFANLSNLRDGISDVSLDEEAADLLRYQRSYQASAKFVSVINEILETLIFRLGS